MARPLELKPYRLADGAWQVNVTSRLSPTGKRQRLRFYSRPAALAHIERLKAQKDNLSALSYILSPAQLLDAASAFELLGTGSDVNLTDVVRTYLELGKVRTASITLAALFDLFLEAKKQRSKAYLRDIAWARKRLAQFEEKLVCDVSRNDIAAALAGMPDSSRNNILRTLGVLFRYGQDLGYLKEMPIRRNDFAEIKRTEIDVLPVSEIRCLLETTLKHKPELLPLLLIETFCGVRPAEAARVEWKDVDLLRRRLTIRAVISKTGTARVIELAPCAIDWVQAFAATPGAQTTGPIAPWPEAYLRAKMRHLRALAGYRAGGAGWKPAMDFRARWNPGSLRDAFCSYHLAHYGSIDRLLTEGGHTNLRTTKDHYLGLVSPEAAADFWNLFPPSTGGKVVPFSA